MTSRVWSVGSFITVTPSSRAKEKEEIFKSVLRLWQMVKKGGGGKEPLYLIGYPEKENGDYEKWGKCIEYKHK